jgi:hypothetical protein
MIHPVQPVKKVDGKGIVQYFDPPDWLIIVVLGALLFGLFFMLRNRRQKPN